MSLNGLRFDLFIDHAQTILAAAAISDSKVYQYDVVTVQYLSTHETRKV
jgi:hypothetical protein